MSPPRTGVPLVPESLVRFYRRMRKAFRRPPSEDAVAIARLSRVVELHHRAATVIRAAVDRSDPAGQEQLRDLCANETRLASEVGDLVAELGGSPPRPEEGILDLPREVADVSYTRNQGQLIGFVQDDIDFVTSAHLELANSPEIPSAMRDRLTALLRDGPSGGDGQDRVH